MNTTNQTTSQASSQATWADRQILEDSLISEKHMTESYNTYAGECVNEQLRTTMLNMLNDVHSIQANLFSTMQQNGWYQVEPAEQQKIQKARQKFQAS